MQTWEDLLAIIQTYYATNQDAALSEVRDHIGKEPIIANNQLTFEAAKRIDDILFGKHNNTHWVQAFHFPQENSAVLMSGETCIATYVGLFTFTPATAVGDFIN